MAIYATGADGIRRRVDGGGTSTGLNVAGYVGEIVYFADSLLRPNHVWADGGVIDAEQWPELAEHAAAAGWAQNEAGQYLTPDLRGRFLLGASEDRAVGTVGGEETHLLTLQEMPKHNHGLLLTGIGSAQEGMAYKTTGGNGGYFGGNYMEQKGGSQPHNNMPPYYAVTPQIRAKVDVVYAKTPESIPASDVTYDNTASGLQADKVQGAVDEIADGLINISAEDLGITLGFGWELITGDVSVVNGILQGVAQFNHYSTDHTSLEAASITLNSNYNIPNNQTLGVGALFKVENSLSGDPVQIYGYGPIRVAVTSNRAGVVWIGTFSCRWDSTWTKKEGV